MWILNDAEDIPERIKHRRNLNTINNILHH